jgi:hypothetical protein
MVLALIGWPAREDVLARQAKGTESIDPNIGEHKVSVSK